jgi:hypothetical protein
MAVHAESQLDEDVRDVLLDRALALAQALGNRDVPETLRDEIGDLALGVGQLRQTEVAAALIEEDVEDRRVQRETTAVDLVERPVPRRDAPRCACSTTSRSGAHRGRACAP